MNTQRPSEPDSALSNSRLLQLLYTELRQLAAARMAKENPGQTLEATALVHEAYLRLQAKDGEDSIHWESKSHFFGAAAEAMRRILIERARAKKTEKHGGVRQREDIEIQCPATAESPDRLVAIDEALGKLEEEHPQVAELLKLRYFAGVPLKDAADLLNISPATAKRRWAFARAFLYRHLGDST
ncbi:MAG: sigma-70 family RNA polymerase sigma factor [Planctomycetales bacterium]|nr:sigma-70 family RNA polymerase sigma factor [Planctomycetales bacterium]